MPASMSLLVLATLFAPLITAAPQQQLQPPPQEVPPPSESPPVSLPVVTNATITCSSAATPSFAAVAPDASSPAPLATKCKTAFSYLDNFESNDFTLIKPSQYGSVEANSPGALAERTCFYSGYDDDDACVLKFEILDGENGGLKFSKQEVLQGVQGVIGACSGFGKVPVNKGVAVRLLAPADVKGRCETIYPGFP